VDDALNVRDKAGMDGKKIARLLANERVFLLGDIIYVDTEPTYKEWYHVRFTYGGTEMEGYVSAEFVVPDGTVDVPVPKPAPPASSKHTVGETYITEIAAGTTVGDFAQTFDCTVRILRVKDGTETELTAEDTLATGDELCVYVGSVKVYSYLIVVKGDVSGDGTVDAKDYMMTKRAVLGTYTIEGAGHRAAAVDNDKIEVRDYMMIKRVALGTYTFTYSYETE